MLRATPPYKLSLIWPGKRAMLAYLAALARRMQVNARALLGAFVSLLALLALTAWIWSQEAHEIDSAARERFEFRVAESESAVRQRMLAYEQVLRGGVALFAANGEVTRAAWRNYVQTLDIDRNYPGIQGIGYAAFFPPAQLKSHVAAVRADGFADYALRPPGERDEYSSIIYMEPFNWRNQRAFGFDMLTEPIRREALLRARDSGKAAISGKIKLQQETSQGVQSGFIMCLPVYRTRALPAALEARRTGMIGQVCSPFRMNNLMLGILGSEKLPKIHLKIFDGAQASAEHLMYDSLEQPADSAGGRSIFSQQRQVEVGGHQWTLSFETLPAFEAAIDRQMLIQILIAGVLVSTLFATVLLFMALNRRRARALASANAGLENEIVERTRLEADLERAKNAAEAANQAKSEFLASVSHELRTPLTLILAPLEQLLATPPGQNWRSQLERVERNALLLLNRVNDILDFSKAEAGKFELHWEAVDVAALVATLAGDAALVAQEHGCQLAWQVDADLGPVCLDHACFEKILLNLLSNALKFTPEGGAITVALKDAGDDCFELTVRDTGIGVAPDKLPLLFQRFQQVDTSIQRQYGGTGIGLALVKDLAGLMGGSVAVQSEPGQGSCFSVRLPRGSARLNGLKTADAQLSSAQMASLAALRRMRLEDSAQIARAAPESGVHDTASALPHVLVVDDNLDMRNYIVELLRDECIVHAAADGLQAWQLLQRQAIDVVVSDVMMPVLDGLSLCRKIKDSPAHAHVLVLLVTARGGNEASVAGLEGGADDYIAKPFSASELIARVRAALRLGQLQKQLRQQSHEAGMAMIASGILHNLGNVLSGVTVSSGILYDRLRQSKVPMLQKTAKLLDEHSSELPERLATVPTYLNQLANHLEAELSAQLQEVEVLRTSVEHARGVIVSEQRIGQLVSCQQEMLVMHELLDSALQLAELAFDFNDISLVRDYAYSGSVQVDKHKLIQILMNLFSNAARALRNNAIGNKQIRVSLRTLDDKLLLEVSDNGVGMTQQQIKALFNQRFTTQGGGHGYGLHSSANWARELGGALSCTSQGSGQGASLVLELPLLHGVA